MGEAAITAVEDVSFDVAEGEFVSLIGPSGCGKSTLFHIIGGLTAEHGGRVAVAGETIAGPHPAIGMVFQEESAFPWRNVIDNVGFALELRGVPRAERLERARHYVALVGLQGFERRHPSELSGGAPAVPSLARLRAAAHPADGRAVRLRRADATAARQQGDADPATASPDTLLIT